MVSVIIPYNKNRGFLWEAKMSVLKQSYPEWEIVNAHSDRNCAYNLNMGLKKAKGEFIKILAEDDILPKDSMSILVEAIGNYSFIYGDAENFGELDGWPERYYDKTVTLESMLDSNGINGGGCLYRTEILREVGGWDESLFSAEEYDLHLKLIKAGYTHKHIPEVVYRYRRHSGNKSGRNREARHKLINQIKQRYA